MDPDELSPNQVLGHAVKEIRQICQLDVNGLDWATSYFILDSGVSFTLPNEFENGLSREAVPEAAVSLEEIEAIAGSPITALLRPKRDADVYFESLLLLLENGYVIADVIGSHHGTGSAGVYLYPPGEVDLNQLDTIWPQS